ncbi:MAG: enoyl-CoA hydratase/isomerase family protein, partial [Phycisphaerae bacterium]|nr:enoyl-CoA hydratase/isomerase family protein [Phycisphaerae bacterium]
VPTIACVQNAAIGGGFGFMAACDFRLTHPEAKIGYPPVATGLSPALMAPWLMRIVGPARARAMLLRGGTISGQVAFDAGIATGLHPVTTLPEESVTLAQHLAQGGPHAMRAMKRFLNELDGSDEDGMLDRAARVSADVIAHPETQARLRERFGDNRGG